jgi:hypothetical protein
MTFYARNCSVARSRTVQENRNRKKSLTYIHGPSGTSNHDVSRLEVEVMPQKAQRLWSTKVSGKEVSSVEMIFHCSLHYYWTSAGVRDGPCVPLPLLAPLLCYVLPVEVGVGAVQWLADKRGALSAMPNSQNNCQQTVFDHQPLWRHILIILLCCCNFSSSSLSWDQVGVCSSVATNKMLLQHVWTAPFQCLLLTSNESVE